MKLRDFTLTPLNSNVYTDRSSTWEMMVNVGGGFTSLQVLYASQSNASKPRLVGKDNKMLSKNIWPQCLSSR